MLARIRPILDVAQMFVVGDDASRLDAATTVHHSNNFRPNVVDEISARVGIPDLVRQTAQAARVKAHFGVATADMAASHLRLKLNEFYDRRNEIVHSLSSTAGYGVDYVLEWTSLFEVVAESMKNALLRAVSAW